MFGNVSVTAIVPHYYLVFTASLKALSEYKVIDAQLLISRHYTSLNALGAISINGKNLALFHGLKEPVQSHLENGNYQ
jgi:hypothetical protein